MRPQGRYRVVGRPQRHGFDRFGNLVELVLPEPYRRLRIRADSRVVQTVLRRLRLPDAEEAYEGSGAVLASLRLGPAYDGTGWDSRTRVFVDHGSRLYLVEPA